MNDVASVLASIAHWLKLILAVVLLVAILAVALNLAFGLNLPLIQRLGHVELAYLAGAFWLAK